MKEYYERWFWFLGSWNEYLRRTERMLSERQTLKEMDIEVAYDQLTRCDFRWETWPTLRAHEACHLLSAARYNVID